MSLFSLLVSCEKEAEVPTVVVEPEQFKPDVLHMTGHEGYAEYTVYLHIQKREKTKRDC